MENGLIHIYTGNGKGKTTASVGLCTRCALCGYKVGFTSFLKDFTSSECSKSAPYDVFLYEPVIGFWDDFSKEDKMKASEKVKSQLKDVFFRAEKENYDLVALDEILFALYKGCVEEEELISLLENKPQKLEVIMTGRNCPEKLYDYADYVSEIKEIKHPYNKNITARRGIEY